MENLIEVMDFFWGIPLTIFIVASGIFFSSKIRFIQITKIKSIFKNTFGKINKNNSYKTIMSVLGGTVGSGNIAGIATAIAIGGPGAIFWMWLVALFSMATKMVEVTLAVKNQKKDEKNNNMGGAMYYIKTISGKFGKILAFIYSIALLIYVLCDSGFVQINTVSTALEDTFKISPLYIGISLAVLSLIIIMGGLKRVSKVLEKSVPVMCILYIVCALVVIVLNIKNIPESFCNIFKYAFQPAPVVGGFAGASIMSAISKGASRGIFANEAGTGTSTTVHATTTNKPLEQGLWGIVEVAFVSFIMCTITALLVMTTNAWTTGLDGAPMVLEAFKGVYGSFGKYILCIMICAFAYTTYIGFYYEYTTCIRYLFKEKVAKYLKWFYLVPLLIAVFLPIEFIWTMADMSVGFIIIPNIVSLIILAPKFKKIFNEEKGILK